MRRTLAITLLGLFAAPLLAGCVGEAASNYESLRMDDWKARYEATEGAFLLDVRTPEEFAAGHIPGAALIPVGTLEDQAHLLPEDKETPIFVYCRSGNRSAIASDALVEMGYTNVVNMRSAGFPDWERAGHPTEAGGA